MLSINNAVMYTKAVINGMNTTAKHNVLMYNSLFSILLIPFLWYNVRKYFLLNTSL